MKTISGDKYLNDTGKLIDQIKQNLNGKHIYDNVFPIEEEATQLAVMIAAALNIPLAEKDEVNDFTLVVDDVLKDDDIRHEYWDSDFAVLYTKSGTSVPTYSIETIDDDVKIEE